MAGYVGSLLAFFVAHCVLISSDTLFAVLNGYKARWKKKEQYIFFYT